jgi:hypothetical protein
MYKLSFSFIDKIKKKHLLTELVDELIHVNNLVSDINQGGCAVFAVNLYDNLIKLGYKPKVCIFVDDEKQFLEDIELLEDYGMNHYLRNRCSGFNHVIIKVDDIYIDSTGWYEDKEAMVDFKYDFVKDFDINILRECANDHRLWNNWFNREDIPMMNSFVNEQITKFVIKNNTRTVTEKNLRLINKLVWG